MKEFIELAEEFAERIIEIENQRKKIGEFLREINLLSEKIIFPVEQTNLENLKIGGIDGGLVKKSFQGIDLMLLRAIAVIFSYSQNKLKVEYYPNAFPSLEPKIIIDPFSELEFEINSNIERQIVEINIAKEAVEKFDLDFLFLNGSIIPHYTFTPEKNSLLFESYRRMLDSYRELFDVVAKNKVILAGVVEDSRGTRFCEIIAQKLKEKLTPELKLLLNKTKDANLLSYALKFKERTLTFSYSSNPNKHPILREFSKFANQVKTFYLKTAEFDRPIRVDFLSDKGNKADEIASVLLALAGHSSYGIPSVLIEADQRAKLSEKDLEFFYLDLINKAGNLPGLFILRREQRPF
jgi:hypothetical protein